MDKHQLGILGLGSYSTTFYITQLNAQFQAINKGYSTYPFVMLNANFNDINPYLPNRFEQLVPVVKNYLNQLVQLGATQLLIPNITLHQTIDQLVLPQNTSIIHPVLMVIAQLKANNINKIALFGTVYTMNSAYMKRLFNQHHIELIPIHEKDQSAIDQVRKAIYLNEKDITAIETLAKLTYHYKNIAPVVLACTELSVALREDDAMVYDMARIQIKNAIQP